MQSERHWQRAIILVDMNAFFASVEQLDHPEWRGLPIAITNGEQGTCIITCSYEARRYGIHTGMRLFEAKERCPGLVICPSNPKRYAAVSTQIMDLLYQKVPDMEIFSIDEAFLDVTAYQTLYGSPPTIGRMLQQAIFDQTGIPSSVGVSGDKTTAKFAAKLQKPNGFSVIYPWEAKHRLSTVPVTELCGIGSGISRFLARYGIVYCGDMQKMPIGVIAKRFGNLGRRLWYMCQGADPEPLQTQVRAAKSMGHGKVMPPNTIQRDVIDTYFRHMSEKLAARLRANQLAAQHFAVGLRFAERGFESSKCALAAPTQAGAAIYQLTQQWLQTYWQGEPVNQVQVTALDPKPECGQLDLLISTDQQQTALFGAIDAINHRYGEFTIMPAPLLKRTKMHNVIAPAWRPGGHRQSLPE